MAIAVMTTLLVLGPLAGRPARAEAIAVTALPSSRLELRGDSTLRKYSSVARRLSVEARVEGSVLKGSVKDFVLAVPVQGLESGEALLDEHLREALRAEEHDEVRARIRSYRVGERLADGSARAEAVADLTIAGVTRAVPLEATVRLEGANVRIQGEKRLLMSDFGVEPPTLMLGLIRTHDEITIEYDLVLTQLTKTRKEGREVE